MATSGVHPEQQVVRERRRRSLAAEHEDAKARERLDGRLRLRRRRGEKFGERRREHRPASPAEPTSPPPKRRPRSDDPGREHRRRGSTQSAHAASHTPKTHTPVTSPVTYGCARRRAACERRDPRCEHTTAFGRPVEPPVWMTWATSSGPSRAKRSDAHHPAVVASVTHPMIGHRDPAFAHLQRRLAVVVSPARRGTRSRRRQADGQRSYARAGRQVPVGGDRGDDVMREVGVIYERGDHAVERRGGGSLERRESLTGHEHREIRR